MRRSTGAAYRWIALAMAFLVSLTCSVCQMAPSVYGTELIARYGLTDSQYATILTCPMLAGFFLCVPAGTLADRIGVRRTVLAGLMVTAAAAVGRSLAGSYAALFALSLVMGTASVVLSANAMKLAVGWFPAHEVGVAVGVVTAAGTAGGAVAQTFFGTLFADLHQTLLACGALAAAVAVLWFALYRDADPVGADACGPTHSGDGETPMTEHGRKGVGFTYVARQPRLWMVGAGTAMAMACQMAVQSFLTVALPTKGVATLEAGAIASLFTWGTLVGGIAIPALMPRMRSSRAAGVALCIAGGSLLVLAWLAPDAAVTSLLLLASGLLVGGVMPTLLTYPARLEEIGPGHVGAAGGMIATLNMAASFLVPSYVIAPLAQGSYVALFVLSAIVLAIPAISFVLLPNPGADS